MPTNKNYRDVQNALLKKLLERAKRVKGDDSAVKESEVTDFLIAQQEAKSTPTSIPTPPSSGIPTAFDAERVSTIESDLLAYSNLPTESAARGAERATAEPEFWETQEFKDAVRAEFSSRATRNQYDIAATRGESYKSAPPPPDIIEGVIQRLNAPAVEKYITLATTAQATASNRPHIQTDVITARLQQEADALKEKASNPSLPPHVRARLINQANVAEAKVKEVRQVMIGGDNKYYPGITPFWVDSEYQVEIMKSQYERNPSLKNLWGLALTSFGSRVSKIFQTSNYTLGGQTEEELTYGAYQSPLGAFVHLMFSYGGSLKDLMDAGFVNVNPDSDLAGPEAAALAQQLTEQANAITDENHYAQSYKQQLLDRANALTEQATTGISALDKSKQDILHSFEVMNNAWENLESIDMPNMASQPKEYREWWNKREELQEQFSKREEDLHNYALGQYDMAMNELDPEKQTAVFERAISLQTESIEARRKNGEYDAWGAATWSREPDRYQAFLRDAAKIELQIGRPLSTIEIRRLKDMYTNIWTELSFQMVFDITNLPVMAVAGGAIDTLKAIPVVNKTYKALSAPIVKVSSKVADGIKGLPVIQWLTKKSVSTIASKIQYTMSDLFTRIRDGYGSTDLFLADLPEIQKLALTLKSMNPVDAIKAYDAARLQGGLIGLQTISFNDFKRIMDVKVLPDVKWGQAFQESMHNSEAIYLQRLKKEAKLEIYETPTLEMAKKAEALASKNTALAMWDFSNQFGKAYTDLHRIHKGSALLDDSIAGQIVKLSREFAGSAEFLRGKSGLLNPEIVKNMGKIDELIIRLGVNSSEKFKKGVFAFGSEFLESVAATAMFAREVWSTLVLTTPRWLITNYMDSSMRSMVYGGNIWDDLITLLNSTQGHFVDEIGFAPMAFNQSLARVNISVADAVPSKILYEGQKPKWGVFSYWADEWDRLKDINKNQMDLLSAFGNELSSKVSMAVNADQASNYKRIWNGFRTFVEAGTAAVTDYNTAIEFTLRTRMFHREYFSLLKKLEPEFIAKGMDSLSPAARELAMQIWKESGGNPAKLGALVDSITGVKNIKAKATWSFVLPAEWDDLFKSMSSENQQVFTFHVKENITGFITSTLKKTGKLPTPDSIRAYMSTMRTSMQDFFQKAASQHGGEMRLMDTSINPNKIPIESPNVTDLKGSAPKMQTSSAVNEAIERLAKSRIVAKGTDEILDIYGTAIGRYANVSRPPGDAVNVVRGADGKLTIEIGMDIGKSPKALEAINNATIKVMSNQDPALVKHIGFRNAEEFEVKIRDFLKDPQAVLNESLTVFNVIWGEFENNPELVRILQKTGSVTSYEGAARAFRDIQLDKFTLDTLNDPANIEAAFRLMSDKNIEPSFARRQAALAHSEAWVNLNKTIKTLANPDIERSMSQLNDLRGLYRHEYDRFLIFVSPGPKRMSLGGGERGALWDLWEDLMAQAYDAETKLSQDLAEAFAKNPAEGQKLLEETLNNFPEIYLNRMGMEFLWDESHVRIEKINIIRNGKNIPYARGSYVPEYVQSVFFSPKGLELTNPKYVISGKTMKQVRRELNTYIHSTFGLTYEQSNAWRRVMEMQAKTWSKQTGKPMVDYFTGLGFQEIDGTFQLPSNAYFLDSGIFTRSKTGTYTFFGTGQKDFGSLVRSTSIMFYEDMKRIALYNSDVGKSLSTLNEAIELATKSKIVGGKLKPAQAQEWATMFMKYFAGDVVDTKLKLPFEMFSKWMADTFVGLRGSTVLEDLPPDAVQVMNRMYVRDQMKPKSSGGAAKAIIDEVAPGKSSDEILDMINNLRTELPDVDDDFLEKYLSDLDEAGALDVEVGVLPDDTSEVNYFKKNAVMLSWARTRLTGLGEDVTALTPVEILQKAFDSIPTGEEKLFLGSQAPKHYDTIGDVPLSVLEEALGGTSQIRRELQEAWDVWKSRRDFMGFSEAELKTMDSFKFHLRQRINNSLGDMADMYERMLYDVESFQDSFVKYSVNAPEKPITVSTEGVSTVPPVDYDTMFNIPIRDYQLNEGMRTWIRNSTQMINNFEESMRALDKLEEYLLKGTYQPGALSADTAKQLQTWKDVGIKAKSDLVSTVLDGGEVAGKQYKGSIAKVNEVMLDYSDRTNFDNMMKNLFPFWMFPSRSLPFWMKTLSTHPELIAFYNKIQRFSRSARYQAGAVTSQGQPLTSMDGYVPIPGTDMWFNPLAAFSFKYVLDITQSNDEAFYRQQEGEDISIESFVAREFLETAPMFGFSVAPWMAWMIKGKTGIGNETLPSLPLLPEIPLIPRWIIADMVDKAGKIGINLTGLADTIYPEAPWHDYLVERQILMDTLQNIEEASGPTGSGRKTAMLEAARTAIATKGDNPLWKDTYESVTNSEAGRAWASFFTGIYPKEFSDAQADLYALRNELNMMKSAMNSEFQASIFDVPADAHEKWQQYLDMQSTPEGWVYRLYTDIGWVKNETGDLTRDPAERNKYLAQSIQDDINQQNYYSARRRLQNEFNTSMKNIPVGAPFAVVSKAYEDYFKQIDILQEKYPFSYTNSFGTNKPIELIQEELTNTYFKMLMSTRPQFNENEDYDVYKTKVTAWEAQLPEIAVLLVRQMQNRIDVAQTLQALHKDQKLDSEFFTNLLSASNAAGLEEWNKQTDSVFDALNNAWRKIYWDEYWNTVGPLKGTERDLAEHDFAAGRPVPEADEMIAWIQQYYGDRFTPEELMQWLQFGDREIYSKEDRILKEKGEEYTLRQEVWDYLSWVGPSKRSDIMDALNKQMVLRGQGEEILQDWMNPDITIFDGNPEGLRQLLADIQSTYAELGIKEPSREYLVEYVQAQDANNQFKELVNSRFKDESGYDSLINIQKVYYAYTKEDYRRGRQNFRTDYPEEYAMLQEYWVMRDAFGKTDPMWSKYYLWEPGTPEQFKGVTGEEPVQKSSQVPISSFSGTPSGRGGTSNTPKPVIGSTSPPVLSSKPGVAVPWPDQMKETIGSTLVKEIETLYAKNKWLSPDAKKFLRGLKNRHPEWSAFINNVLSK